MNHKVIDLAGTDEEVADGLQRLGYIPVSLRTKIKRRIEEMHSQFYSVAMARFQKLDLDFVGNETASPVSYMRSRLYD